MYLLPSACGPPGVPRLPSVPLWSILYIVPLPLRRCSLRSLTTGNELLLATKERIELTIAMLFPFSSVWPSCVFVMPCGVTSLVG